MPVELTNSIGMKLVLIPQGEFMMGSPKEQMNEESAVCTATIVGYVKHLPVKSPQHRVRLTTVFIAQQDVERRKNTGG